MIFELAALRAVRRREIRNSFRELTWADAAVAFLFLVLCIFAALAAYFIFRRAFSFLLSELPAGPLLVRYVLETAFAFIFLFGAVSFVAASFPLIFRYGEVRLLLSLPVEPVAVYIHRFLAAAALSSWPIVIIGLPALFALGAALQASAAYYGFCLIVALLFLLAISLAGGLLSFAVGWLARPLSSGWIKALETFGALYLLGLLIRYVASRQVVGLFGAVTAPEIAASGSRLAEMFAWFPSHPFAELVIGALPGAAGNPARTALAIALALAAAAVILLALARSFFLPIWRFTEEGGFLARPEDASGRRPAMSFPRLFRWRYGYLFEKEYLQFRRDSGEVFSAVFLAALLFFFLLAIRAVAGMDIIDQAAILTEQMLFRVFVSIGYFSLILGMRFAFPSLSLEGRGAWALWSSPVHIHEFFSWKLFFWTAASAIPLLAAAAVTTLTFGLGWVLGTFLVFAVLCLNAAITALTLGQGCAFPDFRKRDAESLSTSPAGIAAVVLGLLYIYVAAGYVRGFTAAYLKNGMIDAVSILGLAVISILVVAVYGVLAPRRMKRLEIDV
ncbi:MAG: hypothetical protein WCT10_03110 [Patescibacteria group bacterium]